MALESLNQKSKVVVYNSDTDLVAKGVIKNHQGLAVEDVAGFEKISYAANPSASLTTSVVGQSVIQIQGNGAVKRYICLGTYGSTLIFEDDILGLVTTNSSDADTATGSNATLDGGSGTGASVDYDVAAGAVTVLTIRRTGVDYKAGDVLTFTPTGSSTAVEITLDQTTLNNAEWFVSSAQGYVQA